MKASLDTHAVEVTSVTKSFNGKRVVDDLSFVVAPAAVFGLIGPNGAGKTTTIRMMMDIIKPDAGRVEIFGKPLVESTKDIIGYMPEDRGMYRKMKVMDSLVYLASLKGMDARKARARAGELLRRVAMEAHRAKQVEELSRGMAQIVGFLSTIIHQPQLVILDEPFANLDPVNTELMKSMITDLKTQGTAIILSTHRMNDVEELCDRVLMVNGGRRVLYGALGEIKSRFRSNSIMLGCEGQLGTLKGVRSTHRHGELLELVLEDGATARDILIQLAALPVTVRRFEIATPPLQEIFLKVVRDGQ